jgi:hypothetical protein
MDILTFIILVIVIVPSQVLIFMLAVWAKYKYDKYETVIGFAITAHQSGRIKTHPHNLNKLGDRFGFDTVAGNPLIDAGLNLIAVAYDVARK